MPLVAGNRRNADEDVLSSPVLDRFLGLEVEDNANDVAREDSDQGAMGLAGIDKDEHEFEEGVDDPDPHADEGQVAVVPDHQTHHAEDKGDVQSVEHAVESPEVRSRYLNIYLARYCVQRVNSINISCD